MFVIFCVTGRRNRGRGREQAKGAYRQGYRVGTTDIPNIDLNYAFGTVMNEWQKEQEGT